MAGSKENLLERQNVYEDAIGVPVILNLADAFSRRSQTQAQGVLKKRTEEGNDMAQFLFGKILRDNKIIVLGKSESSTKAITQTLGVIRSGWKCLCHGMACS
jgi:hypothetical protein